MQPNPKIQNSLQACADWGLIPTEFKQCMTWEEQVLWLFKFLNETVIPAVNTDIQNAEKLATDFAALSAYVDDYFDNLDVQEEVNNKLDELAQSGELEEMIGSYLDFANIKAMDTPAPKFIAHRGANTDAPENSIPAFEIAGQRGFWGAECDVQKTSDGYYSIMHDGTVDRTTNGTGNVADMTLAQIQALTIDAGPNIALYPNLKVPTLEQYLETCYHYNLVPMIELKTETLTTDDMEPLLNIIKKYGFEQKAIFISFNATMLLALRALSGRIKLQLVYNTIPSTSGMDACASNNVDIDCYINVDSSVIEYAHSKGLTVNLWGIASNTNYLDNYKKGADILSTDNMDVCVAGDYIKYVGKTGIKAFSDLQAKLIAEEKTIVRACGATTGANEDDLLNGNYTGFTYGLRDRALSTKMIRAERGQYMTWDNNTTYKYGIKMFDQDGNALADTGWQTDGEQVLNYSGLHHIYLYAARVDGGAFTWQDIHNIDKVVESIQFSDVRIDSNGFGKTYRYKDGSMKFIGKAQITPNYTAEGNVYSSVIDTSASMVFPVAFTSDAPVISVQLQGYQNTAWVGTCGRTTAAIAQVKLYRPAADNTAVNVDVIAEGKWY